MFQIYMPPDVKAKMIVDLAKRYNLITLVETGTYDGKMVDLTLTSFNTIWTIELDEKLYTSARLKYLNNPKINVRHGDSAEVLKTILPVLEGPALFYLDAHFSGGITARGVKNTPVIEELLAIYGGARGGSAILIDDAREMSFAQGYPKLSEVLNLIEALLPDYVVGVVGDIIIAGPRL